MPVHQSWIETLSILESLVAPSQVSWTVGSGLGRQSIVAVVPLIHNDSTSVVISIIGIDRIADSRASTVWRSALCVC